MFSVKMKNPKDEDEKEESQEKWIESNQKIKELEPLFKDALE